MYINSEEKKTKQNMTPANELQLLGNFRESYTPRVLPGKVMIGSAIFCVLFAIFEFATALNKLLSPPSTILSDRFRKDAIMIGAVLGCTFFLLSVVLIALYYTHAKHRVDLYEHGIIVISWRKSTTFLWDEISDMQAAPIYGRGTRPVNWNFTITRVDGIKAQFRGLENLSRLGRIIEHKYTGR